MPRMYNWDLYYTELVEMYLLEKIHLKDIMIDMARKYNFAPRLVNTTFKIE